MLKIRRFIYVLLCALLIIVLIPSNSFALQYKYAETYASEHKLNFIAVKSETDMPTVDISEYTESKVYHVDKIIPTEYGTILYFWPIGAPHGGKNPGLLLIKEDGNKVNLSEPVSRADFFHYPEHENIVLNNDGKTLTFSVSFNERSESGVVDGEKIVLHDAGTYYYKADLETGICIETKFEPLDIMGEEIISAWAKAEIESAIQLGFVPLSLRENYRRNITRGEFAKLAMFFLAMQYGYQGVPEIQYWSPTEVNDNSFFSSEFMNAYCHSKNDRNGKTFRDKYDDKDYVYNNNKEISLSSSMFCDILENKDYDFIEKAYHIGIVNGISDIMFNPDGNITRQEAAAMLMRVYKNYAEAIEESSKFKFFDDENIADWAKEDVYNINALKIMQGVEENVFAPLEGYTVEQAITTFWRLYDAAPVSRKNKNITPLLDYKYEIEHYFYREETTSYFREKSRAEYENFIIVNGEWSQLHNSDTVSGLYIFSKDGGVPYVKKSSSEIKWEINSEKNILTSYETHENSFKMYNKLNGTDKVYHKGVYKTDYDIEHGIILKFERVK